jgi:hypothetical protein
LIGGIIGGVLSVGLCAGGVVLFVGWILALSRPVVDASEQFLALLNQGKVAEAYASTAEGFRAQQDPASFAAAVEQLGLADHSAVSWTSRRITNQEGAAEGTLTTKRSGTRPIAFQLIWEGNRWAVAGVRYGGVDLTSIKAPTLPPSEAEAERMVAEALLSFNQAVKAKDFTAFYARLSDVWKTETTPEKLQRTFQVFVDQGIDIGPIRDLKPEFAPPPAVNAKGTLVVAGRYPTRPSQVGFELRYAREQGGWKLSGITVNVGKPPAE